MSELPTRRCDIWLGDALQAVERLGADTEAAALILSCLGLSPAAPPPVPPEPPGGLPPPPNILPERPGSGTRPPADRPHDGPPEGIDGGHRLPSRLERLDAPPTTEPEWLAATEPLALQERPESRRPPRPLLPRVRRRALLFRALAVLADDGEPDLLRIVRRLAEGRTFARLPRLPRRTLRHGVEVWADNAPWLLPFFQDQAELIAYLRRLVPVDRLRVLDIDGGPYTLASGEPPCLVTPRTGIRAPLLLLSDLGAGYRPGAQSPASPTCWQGLIARLRRCGRRPVALIPFPPNRWPRIPGLTMLSWSEKLDLGAIALAEAGRARTPAGQPPAAEAALLELATVLSPALRITPWLLREARLLLGLAPAMEADLYFSRVVHSRGSTALTLDPHAAWQLRARLAGTGMLDMALALARRNRGTTTDGTAIEEALIELELRGRLSDSTAEEALRPALKALAEPGADAVATATWVAHAWTRWSPAVRALPSARRLAFAASSLVDTSAWLREPSGAAPALSAEPSWLLNRHHLPVADFSVELRRYPDGATQLVIQPPQAVTNALHRIELTRTNPLWLSVSGGRDDAVQTVPLDPDDVNQVAVGEVTGQHPLLLQTLGDVDYRLYPTPDVTDTLQASVLSSIDGSHSALVLDRRLVLVCSRQGRTPETGEQLGFRNPSGEASLSVRVVGPLESRRSGIAVGELSDPLGGTRPIDLDMRPVGPGAWGPGTPHVLIEWTPEGGLSERHVTYAGEGSYEGFDGIQAVDGPALLVGPGKPFWQLVWGGRPNWTPVPGRPPPSFALETDSLEQVRTLAAAVAAREWRGFLLAEPGQEDFAFTLWDELVIRLGAGRIAHDHDGRILGFPDTLRQTIEESAVFIVVGSRNPAEWMATELIAALAGGKPLLWVPLADAPETILQTWPEPLRPAVLHRQWIKVTEIARIADEIARWKPDAAAEAPRESIPETRRPSSLAGGLRERLMDLAERRVANALGLFRVEWSGFTHRLVPAELPTDRKPCLLFIHGEGASIAGAFGGLLDGPHREAASLRARYGDRIFAWQYRSVTVGPIANAVVLTGHLPRGATLHLVTHSGGGLLGELLCLAERTDHRGTAVIGPDEMEHLSALPDQEPGLMPALQDLSIALAKLRPHVERFVRVACPAAGTPLLGHAWPKAVGIADALTVIPLFSMIGLDRLLSDPKTSPGLVSLAPGRGPQPLLSTRVTTRSALTVIAGVRRPTGLWQRLVQFAAETAIEDAEHDLVVPLASTFGGLERAKGVDYLIDIGPDVSHVDFFRKERTRRAIVDALLSNDRPPPGFQHAATLAELQQHLRTTAAR